jgi:hypothetical protein
MTAMLPFLRNEPVVMNLAPKLLLLVCALALTACGGGASAPPSTPSPQTCRFDLVYADGMTSGYAVAPRATSVPKSVTPCGITQVQSVSLGVCITPAQTSELKVQLQGLGGLTVPVNMSAATVSPASCLLTGTLYTVTLPVNSLGNGLNDSWLLSVEDTVPGYTNSTFIGWSLEVKGLK